MKTIIYQLQLAKKGFSLTEALIAFAVLAVAFIPLITTFTTHMDMVAVEGDLLKALYIAQEKIEKKLYEVSRNPESYVNLKGESGTAFDPRFIYTLKVEEVTVQPVQKTGAVIAQSARVKKLTCTVKFKRRKEREVTLETLIDRAYY